MPNKKDELLERLEGLSQIKMTPWEISIDPKAETISKLAKRAINVMSMIKEESEFTENEGLGNNPRRACYRRKDEKMNTVVVRCKECPHAFMGPSYGWECLIVDKACGVNNIPEFCPLPLFFRD